MNAKITRKSKEFYGGHPQIEIPAMLLDGNWEDESWHNDICAHSKFKGALIVPNVQVEAWVDYTDPQERECGAEDTTRYFARVYNTEIGDDVESEANLHTDDLDQFKAILNALLTKYGAEYQIQ